MHDPPTGLRLLPPSAASSFPFTSRVGWPALLTLGDETLAAVCTKISAILLYARLSIGLVSSTTSDRLSRVVPLACLLLFHVMHITIVELTRVLLINRHRDPRECKQAISAGHSEPHLRARR